MIGLVEKLTEDMRNRVRLMVGRAILAAVNDGGAIQTAQADCLADETHDDVERVQEYGFTSVPLPGAEAVMVFPGGNRDHALIIATDDRRTRLTGLQPGEVAIYTNNGDKVVIHADGTIEVVASAKVQITSPLVTMSGNLQVTGNIVAVGDISDHTNKSMAGMRGVYNSHTHSDPQGGSVSTPTGQM